METGMKSFKIATCRLLLSFSPLYKPHIYLKCSSDDYRHRHCVCAVVYERLSLRRHLWGEKEQTSHFKYKRNNMKTLLCLRNNCVLKLQLGSKLFLRTSIRFEDCAALWSLKDKASRIERIVGEHRLFSQGLKELQDWVCEAQRVLNTCISTTTDKSVLEARMLHLEVRSHKIGVESPDGVEI